MTRNISVLCNWALKKADKLSVSFLIQFSTRNDLLSKYALLSIGGTQMRKKTANCCNNKRSILKYRERTRKNIKKKLLLIAATDFSQRKTRTGKTVFCEGKAAQKLQRTEKTLTNTKTFRNTSNLHQFV